MAERQYLVLSTTAEQEFKAWFCGFDKTQPRVSFFCYPFMQEDMALPDPREVEMKILSSQCDIHIKAHQGSQSCAQERWKLPSLFLIQHILFDMNLIMNTHAHLEDSFRVAVSSRSPDYMSWQRGKPSFPLKRLMRCNWFWFIPNENTINEFRNLNF